MSDRDRAKYVEFLVKFATTSPKMTLISIPRLHVYLRKSDLAKAAALKDAFPLQEGKITAWHEIDYTESDIQTKIGPILNIRRASYGNIVYKDLRCGLVHRYELGRHLTDWSPSQMAHVPHYIGWIDATVPNSVARRRLYLPYTWVRQLVENAAAAAFSYWNGAHAWDQAPPTKWWIDE